jgi:phosphohistidine phosphatase
MRLLIMRHGPAAAASATGRDFDRALTLAGREETERVARELVRRGEAPDVILVSPLRRAQETAAIVAEALSSPVEPVTHEQLAPGEDARGLVRSLVDSSTSAVLLVAHEPDVSDLASALLGTTVGGFEAAMIVAVDLEPGRAQRRFVLRPSELAGS